MGGWGVIQCMDKQWSVCSHSNGYTAQNNTYRAYCLIEKCKSVHANL